MLTTRMTQSQMLLEALKCGPVTAFDAARRFGIWRAAARINELRDSGCRISTRLVDAPNGNKIAEYRLERRPA